MQPKNQAPLRGPELSQLYPAPKSYDQLQAERREIIATKVAQLPARPGLRSGIILSSVTAGLLLTPWLGATGIEVAGIVAGIFFIFLLGLIGLFAVKQSTSYVIDLYDMHSYNGRLFAVIYYTGLGALALIAAPTLRWTDYLLTSPLPVVVVSAISSLAFAFIAAKMVAKYS